MTGKLGFGLSQLCSKALVCALLALPVLSFSLEVQPWFCECLEFHFLGSYAYSRFNKVQGARPQLTSPFNVNVLYGGLEFCPSPEWSLDTDLQLSDTTKASFNVRSFALQVRYLWFDDIIGDPVSFATGVSGQLTNSSSLRDVSCPSHANIDLEANFSLGKEFEGSDYWRWRLWCFGAVGHGNRGSPWVRAIVTTETNINELHNLALYATLENGYGRHSHPNPNHFYGYAKIRQKSIDLGLRYGHRMGVWGTLRLDYTRRLLSKACPQNVNTVMISYLVPFSF
jgi:hypothetical protein